MMRAVSPRHQAPAQRREDRSPAQREWRDDRLREARGILADVAHHPESLVLLACGVIETHSDDRVERIGAYVLADLLQSEREVRP